MQKVGLRVHYDAAEGRKASRFGTSEAPTHCRIQPHALSVARLTDPSPSGTQPTFGAPGERRCRPCGGVAQELK